MRGNIGWNYQNYGAQLFMNYTGGYQNWNSPDNAVVLNAALNPSSGGDAGLAQHDLRPAPVYDFEDGYLGADQLSLTLHNMFDTRPPYDSSNAGYNATIASPVRPVDHSRLHFEVISELEDILRLLPQDVPSRTGHIRQIKGVKR